MDELSSNHKKRSIDKIIEQMTADVQNNDGQYNQLGFTSSASPSTHAWSEYPTANVNNRPLHHYISHPPVVPNSGENAVYYADFPYDIDVSSHISKQAELLQQPGYYYSPPRQQMNMLHDNRELIGTVLDVGGGNVVNVVYGSRSRPVGSGGMMAQSYHMLASDRQREVAPHTLGGFVPYHQDIIENNNSSQLDEFGLFGTNDQQQPRTLQPQQHYQPMQGGNRGQLIENLVGNWVPNQSGTYSPFGCTDPGICTVPSTNQQTTQTLPDNTDNENDKGIGRGIRKTRIVAEVKPMRPSYSDVLSKSAPVNANNSIPSTKQSSGVVGVNAGNVAVKTENSSSGKVKNNASKGSAKKNKTNLLKRQLSSGSEEQNSSSNTLPVKIIRSPTMPRKSMGGEVKNNGAITFNSLPRKWVSLDDLDSEKQGTTLADDVFQTEDGRAKSTSTNSKTSTADSLQYKKVSTAPRPKSGQQEEKWEGGTLNNHKAASSPSAVPATGGSSNKPNSGGANTGGTNKRPIQINNNLGTPVWGHNRTGSSKNSKPSSDDKKGSASAAKGDSKSVGANCNRVTTSNRSGSGGPSVASQNGTGGPEKLVQGKRGQRCKRRALHSPIEMVCQPVRQQAWRWAQMILSLLLWFMLLLSDVLGMSSRLLAHLCMLVCAQVHTWSLRGYVKVTATVYKLSLWPRNWWKNGIKSNPGSKSSGNKVQDGTPTSLENNISLPCTGEEAMKRLLACKGKDPYSILGVTPHSSDDDIKKYYKRQAFLVHPDKNSQPGAEEAFKILVHAFELIGEPERRVAYHRRMAETQQVEQAWSELNDLLSQLHQKMEYAANTIRCTNCGKRHRRISVDRPCYAARLCAQCKIHHAAREGDIWAESSMLGFLWHYYACMDGAVYDITEWAACQADNLRHLRANTHTVQYRIVLGRQQAPPRHRGPEPNSDADLENFLNNLYNHSGGGSSGEAGNNRGDQGRNRRKGKRKK